MTDELGTAGAPPREAAGEASEDAAGEAGGTGGTDGAGGAGEVDAAARQRARRRRRYAAAAGARRRLEGGPTGERIGERLSRLAEQGAAAYDVTDWVDFYADEDSVVGELERRTAGLLGMEDAALFPTGTMAQQVALRCWAGRTGNPTVALHPLAHPVRHERDALREVAGLRTVHPTEEPRLPTPEEVGALPEPFGTLMLELPLREAGFTLPSWDELSATVAAARERDAVVHVDGARLWESTTHLGHSLADIAALADSVYVSYYKSLGGIAGAALAGPATLVEEARTWRHRYGGLPFQQWPVALAALAGLEHELPRLPSYVAHARRVAAALGEALGGAAEPPPWWRIVPEVPHTHQFQVWLPYPAEVLEEASLRQAEETGTLLFRYWLERPAAAPGLSLAEVTVEAPGLSWSEEDVRDAVAQFLAYVRRARLG